ncbi:MAG: IS66 family transposase [Parachlamydiales bacterium]
MNATEAAYVEELEEQNRTQADRISSQEEKIVYLEEQLEWLKRHVFGQRSEKLVKELDANQLHFAGFEPTDVSTDQSDKKVESAVKRKGKKKRYGQDKISLPEDLPVQEVLLDLAPEEKVCQETGKPLVKIGEEVTYKLAYRPGSYYLKKLIRPKYGLSKGEGVACAPLPETILGRCRADESLLADIVVKKFGDHLPLYRITELLARKGIGISRQLLSQWVVALGRAFYPLYEAMHRKILLSPAVFIDESHVALQARRKVHQAWMWTLVGGLGHDPPLRLYDFQYDRKHQHARVVLEGYRGTVHSDKYGAYGYLSKELEILWCPCWAHIRRKFFESCSGNATLKRWILRKIHYLYRFDKIAWTRSPEERLRIRTKHEVPIIDCLIERIEKELKEGAALPKSKWKEALSYFCGLIPHLKNYTQEANAHLDNNVAERAIRPLAIGRKNWMFMGSEEGEESAAVLLSLVQSCRALKINPHEYLEDVMRRLQGHTYSKLHELLPDEWAASRTAVGNS